MFSREQMQRAIEDALKSMEGIALELYRRGREPLLEELETVKRERDEARVDAASSLAMAKIADAKHDQKCAEVDMLRGVGCMEDGDGSCGACRKCAYRRGAEAMREACAQWMSEREGISQWVYDDALSALPIPEEP